jgi:hypothetical protein
MLWIAARAAAIVAAMPTSYRHRLIVAFALAFAASGFAARYCMAAHTTPGHNVIVQAAEAGAAHLSHADEHDKHDQHDHDGSHGQHAPAGADDIACAKCCGTCTLTSAVMPSVVAEAVRVASAAVVAGPLAPCSDATVRVDPGIPKRIA